MNAAPPGLDNEWVLLTNVSALPEGLLVEFGGADLPEGMGPMVVLRAGDEAVAMDGRCPSCREALAQTGRHSSGALRCRCGGFELELSDQLQARGTPVPGWRPVMVVDDELYVWVGEPPGS